MLQALPSNIRLHWKSLQKTNTLAYYKHSYIKAEKSLIPLAPGPWLIFWPNEEMIKKQKNSFLTIYLLKFDFEKRQWQSETVRLLYFFINI